MKKNNTDPGPHRSAEDATESRRDAESRTEGEKPIPGDSLQEHAKTSHSEKPQDSVTEANLELGSDSRKARRSARIGLLSVFAAVKDHFGTTLKQYPVGTQLRRIFFNSWAHLLLLLIPVGFALYYTGVNPIAVFFINFAAMIPSIMILSFAVENVIMFVGETIGSLISTTFSNAALLITSVLLLRSRQITVLRLSLIGAILSNLLLMPGLGFFFGGLNRVQQYFNITFVQTHGQMLLLAILSLMLPTAGQALANTNDEGVLKQSRGSSIVLLICYGLFMYFQLRTHVDMYNEPSQKVPKRPTGKKEQGETLRGIASMGAGSAAATGGRIHSRVLVQEAEEEEEEPQLPLMTAMLTVAVSTTLLTFNTLYATNVIQDMLERLNISDAFLGLVILPILSNDPTTLIVAVKDKVSLLLNLRAY